MKGGTMNNDNYDKMVDDSIEVKRALIEARTKRVEAVCNASFVGFFFGMICMAIAWTCYTEPRENAIENAYHMKLIEDGWVKSECK
jgi:hypothetical protein